MSEPQQGERLREHFVDANHDPAERWDSLWKAGDFLPWDRGAASPALEDTLIEKNGLIGGSTVDSSDGQRTRKRALVPGCGRGYDVLLLASYGYDAYGLERSETALKRALEEQEKNAHKYAARDPNVGKGTAQFWNGDFFDSTTWKQGGSEIAPPKGAFDLIFDYTFLCALPPKMRPQWAKRMSELLSEQGSLVCLQFPTHRDPLLGGPPWALPSQVYVEHLSHPGEDLPYDEKTGSVKANPLRRASEGGLERVAHWMPERTHEAGKGTDWVSVWRHR